MPVFRELRDLGDAVWVPALNLYVVSRFRDVVAALRASDTLISGKGVSVNMMMNTDESAQTTSVLTTDGDLHRRLERIEMCPVMPGTIGQLRARLESLTDKLIDELADGSEFEAMSRLCAFLPTRVVADLVGINDLGHERMLGWGPIYLASQFSVDQRQLSG